MGTTGVMLPREVPPGEIVAVARACEAAGFDEVWVVEDCFYTGGLTTAALALAATERVVVGIGILPAVVRNAAFTAMELATLAGAFPGRVHAGLGHGVGAWMSQVGDRPASWLASLEQTTRAVRALLAGSTVDTDGEYVALEGVRLEFPPLRPPPVSLGVRGPRSIAMAGACADGLVLAEPTPPEYVAGASSRLRAAAAEAGNGGAQRVTAYTWALVGDDPEGVLRERTTAMLRSGDSAAHLVDLPADVRDRLEAVAAGSAELSDADLDRLVLRGSPEALRAGVAARHAAGADCVVVVPSRVDRGVDAVLIDVVALGAALHG